MELKDRDLELVTEWFKYLYSIGADESGGVTRLGYTKTEDIMHGAVRNLARNLGLNYSNDEVGNTYMYIENHKEYYAMGSHIDSVVNGGRYDGVAGVVAGILILKWIKDQNLDIPLKVIAFRCEESSAFGVSTVGSSLITHKMDIEKMKEAYNSEDISLYDTLKFRGYNPYCKKIEGILEYLEIHIEQGRILEDLGIKIGIVESIAAATRYWITINGRQDHSGATPMEMRKDALCAASEIVIELEKIANKEAKNKTVGTVGCLTNYPNAFNVVSGKVKMGIDIRGVDWESIQRVDREIVGKIEKICKKRGLNFEITMISKEKPVRLSGNLKNSLIEATKILGVEYHIMNSGAGHDAMKFFDIAPTGMVLIPCKNGISHNKEESIQYEDLILGSKIVLEKLKKER